MDEEQTTNELIAIIWPLLDNGTTRDEIEACINNVLDSWESNNGSQDFRV